MAAHWQGKFWTYHDLLFENDNFDQLNDERFTEIARQAGLNMVEFERQMKDPRIPKAVQRDWQEAVKIGVRGTPTVFINGRLLKKRDLNGFKSMINEEVEFFHKINSKN